MKFIFFLIFVFNFGCSTDQKVTLSPGVNNVYVSSGIEQYFLTNLPFWANFSTSGKCFRKKPIRFLNFENIKKSYNLKYEQMVHLQHMLNKKLYAYKTSSGQNQLSPKDESYIFHNAYQRVVAKSFDFTPPKFKTVSVVWIDPFLNDFKKIKNTFKKRKVLEGHPIILSHCLSSYELEELAQKLKLDEIGIKYLSAEMLNNYSVNIEKMTSFSFNISDILKDKNIILFSTEDSIGINGKYKFVKIK